MIIVIKKDKKTDKKDVEKSWLIEKANFCY